MKRWFILSALFAVVTVFNTVLAWNGARISLLTLAGTCLFLIVLAALNGTGWRRANAGWKRSNDGWAAAQTWGIKQDMILRDVLKELYEYDEEAVEIHNGRSATASFEYLRTFNDDDAAYITEGLRKEGI